MVDFQLREGQEAHRREAFVAPSLGGALLAAPGSEGGLAAGRRPPFHPRRDVAPRRAGVSAYRLHVCTAAREPQLRAFGWPRGTGEHTIRAASQAHCAPADRVRRYCYCRSCAEAGTRKGAAPAGNSCDCALRQSAVGAAAAGRREAKQEGHQTPRHRPPARLREAQRPRNASAFDQRSTADKRAFCGWNQPEDSFALNIRLIQILWAEHKEASRSDGFPKSTGAGRDHGARELRAHKPVIYSSTWPFEGPPFERRLWRKAEGQPAWPLLAGCAWG
jgi:hypothetical protein